MDQNKQSGETLSGIQEKYDADERCIFPQNGKCLREEFSSCAGFNFVLCLGETLTFLPTDWATGPERGGPGAKYKVHINYAVVS